MKISENLSRREFMTRILDFAKKALIALPFVSGFGAVKAFTGGAFLKTAEAKELVAYDPSQHLYAMGVYIDRCIGCGMCARACKKENNVPQEPFYFRTWVERYQILKEDKTIVDSPNGGIDGFPETTNKADVLRSFFVPKLCNQCKNPPCVQVCPVGATYKTKDGVILIDDKYCIGCRYCIQACPYGARYLNPVTKTADKCTFCYHRVVKGMKPACVEVCPTQARVFGDLKSESSPMVRLERMNKIRVLKPDLNTEPKVYYVDLDGEVS